MEYTKEEIILIGNAMYEASCKLDIAIELLDEFVFNFFEDNTLDHLIRVATNNPKRIHATITAISDYLFATRVEIDTFGYPNSTAVQCVQAITQERQKIIDTYKNNLPA